MARERLTQAYNMADILQGNEVSDESAITSGARQVSTKLSTKYDSKRRSHKRCRQRKSEIDSSGFNKPTKERDLKNGIPATPENPDTNYEFVFPTTGNIINGPIAVLMSELAKASSSSPRSTDHLMEVLPDCEGISGRNKVHRHLSNARRIAFNNGCEIVKLAKNKTGPASFYLKIINGHTSSGEIEHEQKRVVYVSDTDPWDPMWLEPLGLIKIKRR